RNLAEYCQKLGEENGRPAEEIFKEFLELMKKYADFFFSDPWPETLNKSYSLEGFVGDDLNFIKGAKTYREECERFTVICLKRNISLKGFDADGFEEDSKWFGKLACWHCVVPDAVNLREKIEKVEEAIRKNEEEVKQGTASEITKEMYAYYRKPHVVRENKMMYVELKLYEDLDLAEGKNCDIRNKYRCPYGEQSNELVEWGGLARLIWDVIWWYDRHWNPREGYEPGETELKWYHYGEPSIIDVTSYEDILKALENGRFKRILEEYKKYREEYKVI
ncbi:MAG: hypothetical protein QXV01_02445, partial [Candidatus Bathyarchaeia archaeon]